MLAAVRHTSRLTRLAPRLWRASRSFHSAGTSSRLATSFLRSPKSSTSSLSAALPAPVRSLLFSPSFGARWLRRGLLAGGVLLATQVPALYIFDKSFDVHYVLGDDDDSHASGASLAGSGTLKLCQVLVLAAKDPRVRRVYVEMKPDASVSLAEAQAITEAVRAFRASRRGLRIVPHEGVEGEGEGGGDGDGDGEGNSDSDKDGEEPCVVFIARGMLASDGAFLAASAADRVVVQPSSMVPLTGASASQGRTFIKDALEKIGVRVEVERRYEYKSAPEMFSGMAPSATSKAQMQRLHDGMLSQSRELLQVNRNLTAAQAADLFGAGPFTADVAMGHGLIDAAEFVEDVLTVTTDEKKNPYASKRSLLATHKLPDRVFDADGFARVSASKYLRAQLHTQRSKPRVEIISLNSTIASEELERDITDQLKRARFDKKTKAVILHVDSPGGDATVSENIADQVRRCREGGTPVIALMGSTCASGGYMIVAQADRIVAQPATMTGSIGAFTMRPDVGGMLDKLGVGSHAIEHGNGGLFNIRRPMTESEHQKLAHIATYIYDRFVSQVSEARDIPLEDMDKLARGRVFLAREAHALQLVDELGGLCAAIEEAKKATNESSLTPTLAKLTFRQRLSRAMAFEVGTYVRTSVASVLTLADGWL